MFEKTLSVRRILKLAPFRTNTFATCRHVLEGVGFGDETVVVNRRAVELAREARDRVAPDRAVAVAGSMSNTVAWLPGTVGPDFAHLPSPEQEAANYREMADILAEAGCDLLDDGCRARDARHRGGAGHRSAGVGGHQHQSRSRRRDGRLGTSRARRRAVCRKATSLRRRSRSRRSSTRSPRSVPRSPASCTARWGRPQRGWKCSSGDGAVR